MFRHYGVILREFVVSTLPSYTSKSNAVVGNIIYILKFKIISLWFYAVEISLIKILKTEISTAQNVCEIILYF